MSIQESQEVGFGGQHAVVIGASMAGLLAGRVLADHFERVTLIERDQLPAGVYPRKGVSQGRHVHALLNKGVSILGEFFPGLFPSLIQGGAVSGDTIADAYWHHFGLWKAQFKSGITGYTQSRPFLEQQVRSCLARRDNVHFVDGCEVIRLCTSDNNSCITGVRLRYRNEEHREEEVAADLVVDASGRGSQAPQWLALLGYPSVEESCVKVDIGYASRIYRRPDGTPLDQKVLIIYPTPPSGKRGGYVFPIEDRCWMVTLVGWLRDYPPGDEIDFLGYARSLPVPTLYEVIKNAEPLTPIVTYKFPSNRWRHYERLPRFPDGFVVLGDAVCSFNPIDGQGMTTAALEAKALQTCLCQQQKCSGKGDITGLARRFQKAAARVIKVPWLLATCEDFRYAETEGHRPPGMRLLQWYSRRVHKLAGSHPVTTLRFYEVLHMLKPPIALFEPPILLAVLFRRQPSQTQHTSSFSPGNLSGKEKDN